MIVNCSIQNNERHILLYMRATNQSRLFSDRRIRRYLHTDVARQRAEWLPEQNSSDSGRRRWRSVERIAQTSSKVRLYGWNILFLDNNKFVSLFLKMAGFYYFKGFDAIRVREKELAALNRPEVSRTPFGNYLEIILKASIYNFLPLLTSCMKLQYQNLMCLKT